MPVINTTTNTNLENGSMEFFHKTLDEFLQANSSSNMNKYSDSSLSVLMEYLTRYVNQHTIAEDDLNKLILIHAIISCAENLNNNNNQTTPNSYSHFINFTKAIQDKESFFNPRDNIDQTKLKESCESTLNSEASTPFSLTSKLVASASHGAISGTSNAITAIALESAKSKGYTENQLRLLKAASVVFNSLVIASHASIGSYMENSNESKDAIIEKMWQSFALSLISTTSLYALANGISYCAKSIENKLAKGFLNALPLAGNVCLLVKGGNSLTESSAMIGTNVATAGVFTTAIQTGWNFFAKQRNAMQNPDIELGNVNAEVITNASSSSTAETPFYNNGDISSYNAAPVYAEINEATYSNTTHDEDGYLIPNRPVVNSAPTLPCRNCDNYENQRFFALNQGKGILVSTACSDDTSNLIRTSNAAIS